MSPSTLLMTSIAFACLATFSAAPPGVGTSGGVGITQGSDCQIIGPGVLCEAQGTTYSSQFPGTNYSWSFTANTAGAFFCGPTNLQNVCVDTTQAGSFTLRLDYVLTSGPKNCSTSVNVNPSLDIADLTPQAVCEGSDVVFTTSVLAGNGPFSYAWTVDHGSGPVLIPGATTNILVLNAVSAADAGQYCVNANGQCGSDQSCAGLEVNPCGGEEFCTLTQGAYGSGNGTFNGQSRIDMITQLLATNLVVGKPGRSLTIQAGNAACVIARLPGNSSPAALPAFGDATLSSTTCQTSPTALPLKNGKFKNVLLGQTITLSLNTRLDVDLSGLGVCENMVTQLMDDGPDGLHGTPDDQPDPGPDGIFGTPDDVMTVNVPSGVINALGTLGLPITAGGILELANRALAGQATGGADLGDIELAVNAINTGFDECRRLIACF